MNTFINAIQNKTFTENGALTHISSGSGILDLFFHGAAIRKTRPEAIIELFNKAFEEDPNLALKTLFYIRDIRGGQGERKVFRLALKNFMENHSEWFTEENIKLIPEYGRFDDLFCLIEDKTLYDQHIRNIYQVINEQFLTDLENLKNNNLTHISLLAKWMPSINASSKETKKLGKLLCNYVSEGNEKQYRQSLSALRKALNILETKMSNKEYDLIDYSKIPSLAAIKYIKAFWRNDKERYGQYVEALKKGETKINTSTLYPYDIVHKMTGTWGAQYTHDETLEQAWKNLPDYVNGLKGLVIADVSGSMNGTPLEVCLSLAVYIAERNKNPEFKDKFITFSAKPELQSIVGNNLAEKFNNLSKAHWDMSTDFQKVFDLVLDRAKACNVPQEDMPEMLLAISDMEFDSASRGSTNLEVIQQRYVEAGYKMPKLVFWNVNSHQTQTPGTTNDKGVYLVSGCSPSVLKYVLNLSSDDNMLDLVKKTVDNERYEKVNFK